MFARIFPLAVAVLVHAAAPVAADDDPKKLASDMQLVLKTHCYRCHGQDGAIEGGMNYVTDLAKLVSRKKVVPGNAGASRLFKRIDDGTMPPPGEKTQLSEGEIAIVKRWINTGAPAGESVETRRAITTDDVYSAILLDLEPMDRRSRRFQRYFSLAHLHNAGLSDGELQTYRNALNKLVNSLSWGSKLVNPVAIDPA